MISSQSAPKLAKFSDMDVRVGHRVQLIVPGPFPQKHYTNVIGYLEGEFIILHLPPEYGDTLHLHEGQHIDILRDQRQILCKPRIAPGRRRGDALDRRRAGQARGAARRRPAAGAWLELAGDRCARPHRDRKSVV